MLQIEIDGKQVSVEQGATVIEAAHKLGTYIPHFCYHKSSPSPPTAVCVWWTWKRPQTAACLRHAGNGRHDCAHAFGKSPRGAGRRDGVPAHQPSARLSDLRPRRRVPAAGFGSGLRQNYQPLYRRKTFRRRQRHGAFGFRRGNEPLHPLHPLRTFHRRNRRLAGNCDGESRRTLEIMPFIGKAVETELSGNVIDLCPVGALTSKPFRFNARTWELNRRKSVSAHDALGSNLIVQTKDHTVRRVLPLENEAINECWLSDRDRFAYEGLYHESRLKNRKSNRAASGWTWIGKPRWNMSAARLNVSPKTATKTKSVFGRTR